MLFGVCFNLLFNIKFLIIIHLVPINYLEFVFFTKNLAIKVVRDTLNPKNIIFYLLKLLPDIVIYLL